MLGHEDAESARASRGFHPPTVVDVGGQEDDNQRDCRSCQPQDDASCSPLPRSVGFGSVASPPKAGTVAESTQARDQSVLSASPSRSSNTWCQRFPTPACCQARSLHQQVMLPPQLICIGSHLPRNARHQHKPNPWEHLSVWGGRSSPFGAGRRRWQEQLDQCPTFIRDNFLGHLDSPPLGSSYLEVVLLDALSSTFTRTA